MECYDIGMHADSGVQSAFYVYTLSNMCVLCQIRFNRFYGNKAVQLFILGEINVPHPT